MVIVEWLSLPREYARGRSSTKWELRNGRRWERRRWRRLRAEEWIEGKRFWLAESLLSYRWCVCLQRRGRDTTAMRDPPAERMSRTSRPLRRQRSSLRS